MRPSAVVPVGGVVGLVGLLERDPVDAPGVRHPSAPLSAGLVRSVGSGHVSQPAQRVGEVSVDVDGAVIGVVDEDLGGRVQVVDAAWVAERALGDPVHHQ